jgi:Cu/Ag efflux protein CusF
VRFILLAVLLVLTGVGCGSTSKNTAEVHHYKLTGRITALNAKDQTASVDQAAIPDWMEAMTMEYPIKSKSEFNTLHVGDKIQATVNVRGEGDYDLSNIQTVASGK